ncbi:hypothetical protein [Leptobacterium sp. I13]|uniref:hypothetical protein n=1 Tax=Leptobacterium meishanense TaxID=3128904 RepID=UPI0030EC89F8
MDLPKFLLGDNTDYPDAIFIVHTDFPRFVINLVDDNVEWLEDLDPSEKKELEEEMVALINEATGFYDRELQRYEEQ